MSDLEKFVELYKSVGIEVEVEDIGDGWKEFVLEAAAHEKLGGYGGFFTIIIFGKNGEFLSQSFYD